MQALSQLSYTPKQARKYSDADSPCKEADAASARAHARLPRLFTRTRPMPAKLIDGAGLARSIRQQCAKRAKALSEAGHQPGLAVILVGDSPASAVYVRHKVNDCREAGIR